MDPEIVHVEIRNLINCHRDHPLSPEDVDRLVDKIEALDDWITDGGFLPIEWAK